MSGKFLALVVLTGSAAFAQNLTCSSDDMHRHYCGVDTSRGVQMVNQRSGSPCQQGYSWGYDRRGVWVDHGCRADFVLGSSRAYGYGNNSSYGYGNNGGYTRRDRDDDRGYQNRDNNYGYRNDTGDRARSYGNGSYGNGYGYGNGYASTMTCSSDDGGRHYCGADVSRGVQMVNQRSGSPCRQGYSWGYDRRGVWVDHGCRADFAVR